ncbi:MAG TPA: TlpA disulfide reductase family protein [Candidatus Limnocylindrales bacterium]|nr:TlpA disulfide reductase family protein [Candidatus Limnocylindrales bacterium]
MAGRLQTVVVIAIAAIITGVLAYSALGVGQTDGVTKVELPANAAGVSPQVGAVPPNFSGVTYDGQPVSLADYAGKPVWLTFGASWCPDCRTESADVEATYQANKANGLVVLGVFINETAADVAGYAGRAGLTFPIAVDPNADIAAAYRSMGIPTHFFIGSDGKVREVRIGALSKDDMARAVAAIMN